ncbi:hypothetical protein [Streptomyces sp. BPTC-684]|uniref:hypothetical protein n=1 Tax=Streptomyces sp. BPTC-684 TaxID=3043734 RepID=UPI0024B267CB|nr:hypothetical protein [Streptomyces sp. BPTC-684]WHM36742.1 hypothetical protein QIY60_07470 [Streptomyces sp. BPTC-684]
MTAAVEEAARAVPAAVCGAVALALLVRTTVLAAPRPTPYAHRPPNSTTRIDAH